jgi:hypothetical protein
MNKISVIEHVPLLVSAINRRLGEVKQRLDAGEELLVLKHIYDLSNKEVEQILDLYEDTNEQRWIQDYEK